MHDDGEQFHLPMEYGLLDHLLEGCQVISREWRYRYVNRTAAEHGRTTRDKLLGRTMMEVYPGIDATPMFEVLRRCMLERTPQELENEFDFGDGPTGWFELRFEPVPDGVFILSIDVTSRHRAEQALRDSREDYRNLVENLEDVVYSLDAEGRFVYVSPAVERFELTAEALRGRPLTDLLMSDDAEHLGEALAGALRGKHESRELRLLDGKGQVRHVRCSCRAAAQSEGPAVLTGLLHDLTEQRRMQTQLHASQRLETVGRLAGGIAHDFNNLLSVVLTYADFAISSLRSGDPLRADIEEIHAAGTRAAALTRQLLAFGRKQVLQPEVVRLDKVVEGMESMLGRLLGEDVEVQVVRTEELGSTKVDPSQIEQVVMNLCVNARDAMPMGGRLTIETANVELDEQYAHDHISVVPGAYVMLAISDNGTGMDEETRSHIFEPFFTTKEEGKGTGLGLSTVFGIVKQSGGYIWAYSEPGHGTTFKVYFPREFSPAEAATRAINKPERVDGTETVLVVEDAPAVRNAAARILSASGYTVLPAASGGEAILLCEAHAGPIHLLLTDVVMPKMSGRDLAQRLLAMRPALKIAYMSGYTDDAITHHGVLDPGARLINKPFSAVDLTIKVRQALDSA